MATNPLKKPRHELKTARKYCEVKKIPFTESIYDRLDLTKDANLEAIIKECSTIAEKKSTLEEKQQYAEIANLLADPSRRAIYDTTKSVEYVNAAQTPGGTHHAPGMHKTVRVLVGDDKLNKMRDIWSLKPKAKDVNHILKCSLEDYYNGKNVKLKIQRNQACPTCHGRKAISPTQLCTACAGKGTIRTPNELQFNLPVGCRNGYRKRLKGEGDCPANQIPSDIYLICEQKKHDIYTRVGNDLVASIQISFGEHLVGCYKYLRHLKETSPPGSKLKTYEMLKVKIPPFEKKLVLEGRGLPIFEKPTQFGDLFLEIIVEIPKKFTPEQRALLEEYLPDEGDVEEVQFMDDMDETIETHELQPFTGLGNDKVDNSRDDQDQVHDGIEKCPVS
ncbi:Oidioi.mRNA.OKI2018_I69.chr2.g8117.t1.cds [Oikopleura dioica]|uniref:Oidioi.mRNA.OKI2018_I69.chr2.g8117.t1.cds n=1 Tax=Oikopleura dioica TaxID=34765 RepID=A0ABN7TEL1_OIKDI|nr:Oidioi.mRNA.OKI2018_I69.chr2.g8117.t1.cds [Oikopleura dioica]